MAADFSQFSDWIHNKYIKENRINTVIDRAVYCPLFRSVQKKKLPTGNKYKIAQWAGTGGGGSRDSKASYDNSVQGTGPLAEFEHKIVTDFSDIVIERKAQFSAQSMESGFVGNAFDELIMQKIQGMIAYLSYQLYRSGANGGEIGKIKAAVANPLSFTVDDSALMFHTGGLFESSAAKYDGSTDSRKVKNGSVLSVNLDGKSVSIKGTGSMVAGDILWRRGDYLKSNAEGIKGFQDYIPSSITSSDSFLGANRSTHKNYLAGYYLSVSDDYQGSTDKASAIIRAINFSASLRANAFPSQQLTRFFINPLQVRHFVKSQRIEAGSKLWSPGWIADDFMKSFGNSPAFFVFTPSGIVSVYADAYCPFDEILGINPNDWTIYFLGDGLLNFKTSGREGSKVFVNPAGDNNSIVKLESYRFFSGVNIGNSVRLKLSSDFGAF